MSYTPLTDSPPPKPHPSPPTPPLAVGQWWQCRDPACCILITGFNDAAQRFKGAWHKLDGTRVSGGWNYGHNPTNPRSFCSSGDMEHERDLLHIRPAPLMEGQWWANPNNPEVRIHIRERPGGDGLSAYAFSENGQITRHGSRKPEVYEFDTDGRPFYPYKRGSVKKNNCYLHPVLGPLSSTPIPANTSFKDQLAMAFKIDPAKVADAFGSAGTATTPPPTGNVQSLPKVALVENVTPPPAAVTELMAALAKLGIGGSSGLTDAQVRQIITDELDKIPARKLTITIPPLPDVTVENQHPKFAELMQYIGLNERIFISGPAGSGKTTAVEVAATTLKRPFFIQPPVADKFELLGFIDAAGNYQATEFHRWATTPNAILLLDEVDGSFPQPLLALNMALANGYAVFPTGKVEIPHGNAVVCTANTWGNGSDFDYVGRAKLDAAFLNRFSSRLQWDYDEDFEQQIVQAKTGATKQQVRVMQQIRANARAHGVKVVITPRDTMSYCRKRAAQIPADQVLNSGVLASLSADARQKLMQNVKVA